MVDGQEWVMVVDGIGRPSKEGVDLSGKRPIHLCGSLAQQFQHFLRTQGGHGPMGLDTVWPPHMGIETDPTEFVAIEAFCDVIAESDTHDGLL
jgi:hypothetical protein